MKKFVIIATVFAAVTAAQATLYTTNWTTGWDNGTVVPDNSYSGWTDSRTLDAAPTGLVTPGSVAVTLDLTGGWNGDLYAYLVNSSSGFCVLLDRIGTGTYGNAGNGFNVTLSGTGAAGLGTYMANGSGLVTGNWQPDNTSGSLGSFTTQGGTWTLFVADLSGGGVTTVQSWGLQMDIVAVPEVETWVAAALAGGFGAFWLSRQLMVGLKRS